MHFFQKQHVKIAARSPANYPVSCHGLQYSGTGRQIYIRAGEIQDYHDRTLENALLKV